MGTSARTTRRGSGADATSCSVASSAALHSSSGSNRTCETVETKPRHCCSVSFHVQLNARCSARPVESPRRSRGSRQPGSCRAGSSLSARPPSRAAVQERSIRSQANRWAGARGPPPQRPPSLGTSATRPRRRLRRLRRHRAAGWWLPSRGFGASDGAGACLLESVSSINASSPATLPSSGSTTWSCRVSRIASVVSSTRRSAWPELAAHLQGWARSGHGLRPARASGNADCTSQRPARLLAQGQVRDLMDVDRARGRHRRPTLWGCLSLGAWSCPMD